MSQSADNEKDYEARMKDIRDEHDELLGDLPVVPGDEPSQHLDPPVELVDDTADSHATDSIELEIPVKGPEPSPNDTQDPLGLRSFKSHQTPQAASEPPQQPPRPTSPPPIPDPINTGGQYDQDADWTPENAKGLDLSDGEALVTSEEAEPSPIGEMDSLAAALDRYVRMQDRLNRRMIDILIEAVADIEDQEKRFDRLR